MVAIAPLEATRGEGAEGIALEVPRLLCEEVGIEDIAVVPRGLVLLQVQAMIWLLLKKQLYFNLPQKLSRGCLLIWSL